MLLTRYVRNSVRLLYELFKNILLLKVPHLLQLPKTWILVILCNVRNRPRNFRRDFLIYLLTRCSHNRDRVPQLVWQRIIYTNSWHFFAVFKIWLLTYRCDHQLAFVGLLKECHKVGVILLLPLPLPLCVVYQILNHVSLQLLMLLFRELSEVTDFVLQIWPSLIDPKFFGLGLIKYLRWLLFIILKL